MRWSLVPAVLILAAAPALAGDEPPGAARPGDDSAPVLDLSREREAAASPATDVGPFRYPPLPPEPALPSRFHPDRPATGMDLFSGGIQGGIMGGLVGGGISFLYLIAHDDRGFRVASDWPGDDASFTGAVLGWTIGSSIGMHVADRAEGNLPLVLTTSLIFASAAAMLCVETDKGIYLPLAVAQFGIGMALEQGTHGAGTR